MASSKSAVIRPLDTKINALSRLIDSGIIGITLAALLSMYQLEWNLVYGWLLLAAVVTFGFISESNTSYRSWRAAELKDDLQPVLFAWAVVVVLACALLFLCWSDRPYHSAVLVAWFLLTPIELISWHSILRMMMNAAKDMGANHRNVAILGATSTGISLRDRIKSMPWTGMEFVGFYDDRAFSKGRRLDVDPDEILGGVEHLIAEAKAGAVDIIFVALPMKAEERIKRLFDELADTTVSVYLLLDFFSFDLLNSRWMDIQGMPAVSIYESPHIGVDSVSKRLFDLVVGSLILSMIALPMCFIALGVKRSSPGPVFFRQKRYGAKGKPIYVWKFRSMRVMDQGDGEVKQATKGDSRITPFGAFLRKTSLDELPQFFNVITGSMSIVGPRPHAVSHNEQYRGIIRGYMLRHKVKPGITGWAQINGFRGETDTIDKMEGRIRYDLEYIQRWSVWLDIKIIILTVLRGFTDKKAY